MNVLWPCIDHPSLHRYFRIAAVAREFSAQMRSGSSTIIPLRIDRRFWPDSSWAENFDFAIVESGTLSIRELRRVLRRFKIPVLIVNHLMKHPFEIRRILFPVGEFEDVNARINNVYALATQLRCNLAFLEPPPDQLPNPKVIFFSPKDLEKKRKMSETLESWVTYARQSNLISVQIGRQALRARGFEGSVDLLALPAEALSTLWWRNEYGQKIQSSSGPVWISNADCVWPGSTREIFSVKTGA